MTTCACDVQFDDDGVVGPVLTFIYKQRKTQSSRYYTTVTKLPSLGTKVTLVLVFIAFPRTEMNSPQIMANELKKYFATLTDKLKQQITNKNLN